MTFLPIVERELRLAARRPRTYWTRLGAAVLAATTLVGIVSPALRGFQAGSVIGAQAFQVMTIAGCVLCLMAGAFITADCLSAEKRDGTLGLLLLTNLRSHDIVLGKLLASGLNPFYALIAALPWLALPLMLGGVTPGEFWRVTLALGNALFLSLAIGMFVSAVSRNGYKAVAATLTLVGAIAVLPMVKVASAGSSPSPTSLQAFSPADACLLSFAKPFAAVPGRFWLSLLLTQATAWGFLGLATWALPRCYHDRPARAPAAAPSPAAAAIRRPKLADYEPAVSSTEPLPGIEPALWLALRDPRRLQWFWGFIGFVALLWLIGLWRLGGGWLQAEVVFVTVTTLHLIIKGWLAIEATRHLAEGRRSGELELLLVTPLAENTILEGRMLALKRQFAVPIALVLAVDVLLLLFGMQTPGWWGSAGLWAMAFLVGTGMFLADCYTISWVGLWRGLTARTPTQAFVWTLFQVLVVPWMIFLVSLIFLGTIFGAGLEVLVLWFIVGMGNCFGLCSWSSQRLAERFRAGASGG